MLQMRQREAPPPDHSAFEHGSPVAPNAGGCFDQHTAALPNFVVYQHRSTRQLPVRVLEPPADTRANAPRPGRTAFARGEQGAEVGSLA